VRRLAGLVSQVTAGLLPGGTGSRTLAARARRFLSAVDRPLGDRITCWNSFFAFELAGLMRPELLPSPDSVLRFHRDFFPPSGATSGAGRASPLAQVLAHNFGTYLPHDLNVKVDRTSMAHALEARSPFLDTALIEYAAGLPDNFKLRGRTTKYILRKAFADLMPPAIQGRGKMGFGLPLGTWFRGELRRYVEERICAPDARLNQFLRPEVVRSMFQAHVDGRADIEHRIWLLLTVELWLRNLPLLTGAWPEPAAPPATLASQPEAALSSEKPLHSVPPPPSPEVVGILQS
jgi:asparagine synthase (glutamine-hydrolysing)